MRLAALFCLLMLTACAAAPPPIDVRVECPPMRAWTGTEQEALGAALAPIPQESMLWVLERDWQATRDAIRACRNQPSNRPKESP